jgi:hypothetical protein
MPASEHVNAQTNKQQWRFFPDLEWVRNCKTITSSVYKLTSLSIELNTGILAACLPALRPIFAFLLETAHGLRSSQRRTGASGSGIRGQYYLQDEEVKLGSLPSRSTLSKNGGYGVSVVGGPGSSDDKEFERILNRQGSASSSGPMSRLEASIREHDSGSEDNIWPQRQVAAHMPRERERYIQERNLNRGIMRTTEVRISR